MFTKKGVVANGKEYAVDAICIATGFETTFLIGSALGDTQAVARAREITTQNGYEVIGAGGLKLSDYWADGPRTLDSYSVHGFPNLWLMSGPQGIVSSNAIAQLDVCGVHAAHMITKMMERGQTRIECRAEAERAYCEMIYNESDQVESRMTGHGQAFFKNCTPGYYNSEGSMTVGKTLSAPFGGNDAVRFFETLRKRRDEDRAFDDYDVM